MTSKLIAAITITFMLFGCRNRNIREAHSITDLSKPVTLTFKLKSGQSNAGYIIKGRMNGTVGYSSGILLKRAKFPSYGHANNIADLDSVTLRKYVFVSSDSIAVESNSSIGQNGLTLGLHFIPGTATEGKIDVEFWEHPTGIY